MEGDEPALEGLQIDDAKYKVEQPINVVANPTLVGTEGALTGLQVGDTKYKVGGGLHCYCVIVTAGFSFIYITDNDSISTSDDLSGDLYNKGYNAYNKYYVLPGNILYSVDSTNKIYSIEYVYVTGSTSSPRFGGHSIEFTYDNGAISTTKASVSNITNPTVSSIKKYY